MSNNYDYIKWNILINRDDLVEGIAVIKKGYQAELHYHKEEEEYIFLYGVGKLYNNGLISIIRSPNKVVIKSNNVHAMTPISDYVILLFRFRKGKFNSIKYKYNGVYLYGDIKSKL